MKKLRCKLEGTEQELGRLEKVVLSPTEALNAMLVSRETSPVTTGVRAVDLLKRPQISYLDLAPFDPERPSIPREVAEQVEIRLKYEGYIKRQLQQVEQMRKLESRSLPGQEFDYKSVTGLRLEAVEKLNKIHPLNIGQASRISGVSPADITVLTIWLEGERRAHRD